MQRFKTSTAVGLALAASLSVYLFTSHAQDQTNVAVVNGVPIPQARMDMILKSQVQQGQQDTPEMRKNVKEVLITREIIAQEALKKGLDKSPEVQTQLDLAKQEFLIRAYFEDLIDSAKPTEEQVRAEYEKIKASQTEGGNKKEYQPRHILVKTEKEAKAVLASLNKSKGKNFATLAKQKSMDSGSKAEGGLLDWSDGSTYVPEFTQALTKLEKGQYTRQPVKSQFGYHIIMLEDTRTAQFPAYDEVKERVQQELLKQTRDKKIDELRAAAKIE